MSYKFFAILICLASAVSISAQQLEWSADMNAVINNREGGNSATPDQTFIFTRITPQIGVSMDKGQHRIMGGVTWYQPMNDELHGYKVTPSLHYEYQNSKKELKVKFGVIANELNRSIPTYLRSDSNNYVHPNIMGLVVDLNKKHFWLYSWLNWRQLRTHNKREAFEFTTQLGWKTTHNNVNYRLGTILYYNHYAMRYNQQLGDGVVDNTIVNPQFEISRQWPQYNTYLNFTAGLLLSLDRDRAGDNKWHTPAGFLGQFTAGWKWLLLSENIYAGQRQMPLYNKFGPQVYQGDQYFHNKFYSRTDLIATIFEKDFVNMEVRLTYHITNETTAFWQQLAVRFFLDRALWKAHKNNKRGAILKPQF